MSYWRRKSLGLYALTPMLDEKHKNILKIDGKWAPRLEK